MKNLTNEELLNYIIENDATLREASEYFGVSLSTVKKRMKVIKENLDFKSLSKLENVARKNEQLGRQKGGLSNNSGKKRKYTLEEIALYAMQFIAENMTMETASEYFGIPKSTLFDNFKLLNCEEYQELYSDLVYIYECHNHGVNNDTIFDVDKVNLNPNSTWLRTIQYKSVIHLESLINKYNLKLEELSKSKNK